MDKFEIQCYVIILFEVNYVLIMQKKKKNYSILLVYVLLLYVLKKSYDLLKIAELKKIINASN